MPRIPSEYFTKLYAFGSNGAGQLGVGHQDDLTEPQLCKFTSFDCEAGSDDDHDFNDRLIDDCVEKLVAGGNHTVILTKNGHVYATGNNIDGRCGLAKSSINLTAFAFVRWAPARNVTDIAATWEATFFVEDSSSVSVCGTGNKGELGLGEEVLQTDFPRKVFEVGQINDGDVTIKMISASMSHVVLLLSDGSAYGFGNCRKGQLGDSLQSMKNVWKPHRIDIPFPAADVTTGRDFTLIRGHNQQYAILGDLSSKSEMRDLELAFEGSQAMSGWSTVYKVQQKSVQGFGQGRRGQLPPVSLPPIANLAPGSEHCVAHLVDGDVVAWGWGEHGNCGLPIDERGCVVGRYNTIAVPCEDGAVAGVGAGCASSFTWVIHHP